MLGGVCACVCGPDSGQMIRDTSNRAAIAVKSTNLAGVPHDLSDEKEVMINALRHRLDNRRDD